MERCKTWLSRGLTEEYSRWVARSKSIRPVSVTWTCFNLHLSQVWWWGDDVQDGNNDDNEDDLKPLDLLLSQVATETEHHLTWEETTKQEQRQRSLFFVCHPSCSYRLLLTLKLYICSFVRCPAMVTFSFSKYFPPFPFFLLLRAKHNFLLKIFKCQSFLRRPEISTVVR